VRVQGEDDTDTWTIRWRWHERRMTRQGVEKGGSKARLLLHEYEGERCGARLGRAMIEKCEVTLEVDESMPNGTQGERYGSDG
jgi:hypothetical protein